MCVWPKQDSHASIELAKGEGDCSELQRPASDSHFSILAFCPLGERDTLDDIMHSIEVVISRRYLVVLADAINILPRDVCFRYSGSGTFATHRISFERTIVQELRHYGSSRDAY